jgi:copper chaperone
MKTYKFKTTIKCGGCIATITPIMDRDVRIKSWDVDTLHPDNILSVTAEDISSDEIVAALNEAGYGAHVI